LCFRKEVAIPVTNGAREESGVRAPSLFAKDAHNSWELWALAVAFRLRDEGPRDPFQKPVSKALEIIFAGATEDVP
jgi:hypothetical protein